MSTDLSDYGKWYDAAKRSAEAANGIYDRDSVEHELALHLLRALRELEARTERGRVRRRLLPGMTRSTSAIWKDTR